MSSWRGHGCTFMYLRSTRPKYGPEVNQNYGIWIYETGALAKIFSFPSVDMNNAMFHHIDGKMPFHHWLVYPAAEIFPKW